MTVISNVHTHKHRGAISRYSQAPDHCADLRWDGQGDVIRVRIDRNNYRWGSVGV